MVLKFSNSQKNQEPLATMSPSMLFYLISLLWTFVKSQNYRDIGCNYVNLGGVGMPIDYCNNIAWQGINIGMKFVCNNTWNGVNMEIYANTECNGFIPLLTLSAQGINK